MTRLMLLIVLITVCSALAAPCAVIRVPDDEPTIGAGVAAASAGDTVLVASGTYHEDDIWMKDGVCLTSETGQADCVTIDAQFQGKVFYCQAIGSESSIIGFTMTMAHGAILCRDGASPTIRNCVFTANSTAQMGGGMYCDLGATPVVENCTFQGNFALYGGAIACTQASSPMFSDCVFSGNISNNLYGGAVYCTDESDPVFTDCEFTGNTAQSGGAACLHQRSAPTFTDCSFSGNSANSGGGINCSLAFPTLTNCSFSGNTAEYNGGAMSCNNSGPVLVGCKLSDNSANKGGAVMCLHCDPTLTTCTFSGNTASEGGGAVYCWSSSAWLTNCTISGNHVTGGLGAGIFCYDESWPKLWNCVVAFNSGGAAMACDDISEATLTCCDVYGNTGGDWVGCISGQYGVDGNICEDPLFCAGDNPFEPFTLHANSPCTAENNPECGLVGAWDIGCGSTAADAMSWGSIKAMYR